MERKIKSYVDSIETFLGMEYAEVEWSNENKRPINTFLHTNSYKDFISKNKLFLFGRRGTGKTTMMRMLEYEINNRKLHKDLYSYAYLIASEEAFNEIITSLGNQGNAFNEYNTLINYLIDKWVWTLNVSAMIQIVNCENIDNPDINLIKRYLTKEDLFDLDGYRSKMTPFVKLLKKELENTDKIIAKSGVLAFETLFNTDYKKAKEALTHFLSISDKTCLIMVDSIDLFYVKDKYSRALITALIEATLKAYTCHENEHILVKAAFPSEIYSYIHIINIEKIMSKILFINWRHRDLVSFLAIRYLQMVNKNAKYEEYLKLSVYNNALEFLYTYLPTTVTNLNNVRFDTLAYIIRHTQKKPRELVLLMNVILTLAKEEGINLQEEKIPEEIVTEGIHIRPDVIAEGVLNFYEKIYPNAMKLVLGSLQGSKNILTNSELDKQLKGISDLRNEESFSRSEIKDLLVESGVIGIICKEYILPKEKIISEAVFEYQKKGKLVITNNNRCVIHPLFNQYLHVKVDKNVFIYPEPYDDYDEEGIVSCIKEQFKKTVTDP